MLDISRGATRRLTIDNEWVQFKARFNGASQEVAVPVSMIAGVFAKESGYGFAFTVPSGQVPPRLAGDPFARWAVGMRRCQH